MVFYQLMFLKSFLKIEEYGKNPLYCVSVPGYIWQSGMKYTDIKFRTLRDKNLILLFQNNIRAGISSLVGDRYVKSDGNKKILHVNASILYQWAMSEHLLHDETKFDRSFILKEVLNSSDDSDFGYFFEVDLKYADITKYKTKNILFAPENKKIIPEVSREVMRKIEPDTYTQTKKLICDWSDKKNYLIQYRMLKFYDKHGIEVMKVHTVISFKQSKWLENYKSFDAPKRNNAENDFEKDFYKLLNNSYYGKTKENVRSPKRVQIITKDDADKNIKHKSKLTFNGILKSSENYDSYTFKQNEVLLDKPIYLGFSVEN